MHDETDIELPFSPRTPSVADRFFRAVERLAAAVDHGPALLEESQYFSTIARIVRGELERLEMATGWHRIELKGHVVGALDGVTAVAMDLEPEDHGLHSAAFEVAVRASQLAAMLRDGARKVH